MARVEDAEEEGGREKLQTAVEAAGLPLCVCGAKGRKKNPKKPKTLSPLLNSGTDQSGMGRSGPRVRDVAAPLPEEVASFLQSNPESIKS